MSFHESKMQILGKLFSKYLSVYLLDRDYVDGDKLPCDIIKCERLNESRAMRTNIFFFINDIS